MTESPTPLYSCARCGLRIDPTVQRDVDLDQVTPTASCRRCGHEYSMCKDLVRAHLASIWVPAYVPYDVADHLGPGNPRAEERATVKAYMVGLTGPARLRSAMAAMSNAMRCCHAVAREAFLVEDGIRWMERHQRDEFVAKGDGEVWVRNSLEWSRRVRAGVAALPKPGPAVCCQSEED